MALKAVRLESVPPLAEGLDPDEIEDSVLRQRVFDGYEPAAQWFGGAVPYEPDSQILEGVDFS